MHLAECSKLLSKYLLCLSDGPGEARVPEATPPGFRCCIQRSLSVPLSPHWPVHSSCPPDLTSSLRSTHFLHHSLSLSATPGKGRSKTLQGPAISADTLTAPHSCYFQSISQARPRALHHSLLGVPPINPSVYPEIFGGAEDVWDSVGRTLA